jgi:hypothetical protein
MQQMMSLVAIVDAMPAPDDLEQFLHDPDLHGAVQRALDEAYDARPAHSRPEVDDVIAAALDTVASDLRDHAGADGVVALPVALNIVQLRAEDQADCGKTDNCTATAAFLVRLAAWLEAA